MARDNLTIAFNQQDYDRIQIILSDLKEVDQTKAVADGLKEGSKIIAKETRRNMNERVKKRTGQLSKSLTNKVKRKAAKAYVGFKRPNGAVAHLIDKGTADRWTKAGRYTGHVKPKYFHTDSVNENGKEALAAVIDGIIKGIDEIVNNG